MPSPSLQKFNPFSKIFLESAIDLVSKTHPFGFIKIEKLFQFIFEYSSHSVKITTASKSLKNSFSSFNFSHVLDFLFFNEFPLESIPKLIPICFLSTLGSCIFRKAPSSRRSLQIVIDADRIAIQLNSWAQEVFDYIGTGCSESMYHEAMKVCLQDANIKYASR